MLGHVFFLGRCARLFGHKNWGLEIMADDAKKKLMIILSNTHSVHTHMHTEMFLCVIGGIVFTLSQGNAGKVLSPKSTKPNYAERIAIGCCQTNGAAKETVLCHCSGGINLLQLCWESGGNLLDLVIHWHSFQIEQRQVDIFTLHHPAPAS